MFDFLRRLAEASRQEQSARQNHLADRAAAQAVLDSAQLEPLAEPPFPLAPGEVAYFNRPAQRLEEEGADLADREKGRVVVTNRHLYFVGKEATPRCPVASVQRIDTPYTNVLQVVYLAKNASNETTSDYYQLDQPLVLAAYLSRLAGFRLMIG